MIGVTIGIGPMARMAQKSAQLFAERCGLEVTVLGHKDLDACNLTNNAWLKFYIFDLVASENVVYFDADIATLADYEPRQFENSPELIAVRDVQSYFTSRDARLLGFPLDRCMNGGWFIANRQRHYEFFQTCKNAARDFQALLTGIRPEIPVCNEEKIFFDQPVLNLLIYRTDLPVRFLDRRYNYLGYGRGDLWAKQANIFNAHFARGLRVDYSSFLNGRFQKSAQRWNVNENAFRKHSGDWEHSKDGTHVCRAVFREDGTISGWPRFNYWVVSEAGELVLSYWENADMTMTFDGMCWRSQNGELELCRRYRDC